MLSHPYRRETPQLRLDVVHCETRGVRRTLLAFLPLVAVLTWVLALVVDSHPWDSASSLLIGVGLTTLGTVATVGMVVTGGRWAHRLAIGTVAMTLVIALVRPIDVFWWIGLVVTGVSLVALLSPGVTSSIRKLPSATGPQPRAIAPALILLSAPALLGMSGTGGSRWAVLFVGLSAPVFAFMYGRVIAGGLIGIRIGWPVSAVALSPLLGVPVGVVSAALGVTVAVMAWNPTVKAAYHPPVESGTAFPIPPELAPTEILDAAHLDDTGRPT